MLLFFLKFLHAGYGIKAPAVFSYFSTRMLLAALTTLFMTIFLGPYVIRKLYELKTGQSIRVDDVPMLAELHQKKKNTPTMGGILMLFSMVVALLLWMDLTSPFTLILLITTLWLGLLGAYDDYLKMKYKNAKGLGGKKKLGLQLLLGALISSYLLFAPSALHTGKWFAPPTAKEQIQIHENDFATKTVDTENYMGRYYFPFKKAPLFVLSGGLLSLGVLFAMFVVAGASNAVNLTDGLDGLASGTVAMVAAVLALFGFLSNNIEMARYLNLLYIEGSGEIAVFLCALFGACLGFLWYNGYPAQIFMGDTGSLALGGILGVSAILMRREFLLALAGGIFVAEALSVIAQVGSYKLRNKKRVLLCAPLHHHFEYKGWPETKVVMRFWIIALVLAMISLISIKFQ